MPRALSLFDRSLVAAVRLDVQMQAFDVTNPVAHLLAKTKTPDPRSVG